MLDTEKHPAEQLTKPFVAFNGHETHEAIDGSGYWVTCSGLGYWIKAPTLGLAQVFSSALSDAMDHAAEEAVFDERCSAGEQA